MYMEHWNMKVLGLLGLVPSNTSGTHGLMALIRFDPEIDPIIFANSSSA